MKRNSASRIILLSMVVSLLAASCSPQTPLEAQSSAGTTRVVVWDNKDPSQYTLVDTIPGTYSSVSTLVGAYLKFGEKTPNPRAKFPYDEAHDCRELDVSWVQPLTNYYLGATVSSDGKLATMKFLAPAYHYFDQPATTAHEMYYAPIQNTISMNFPSVERFVYDIQGRSGFNSWDVGLTWYSIRRQ